MSSSSSPAVTRCLRWAAVAGSGVPVFADRGARTAGRAASANSGACATSGTAPCDQRSSSDNACLHGTLRLGQSHRYDGPDTSTTVV
ncbi:hypothetical protein B7C42_08351 [Nocardia cerradoensis]|uniref:Uncharacterized protein n=1 Tax=Nocardia cerradoensis TaxID=85688 RepID=A0A231GSY0_9NOCA|nr:hypothetical protein B7C42_08351 [Nocardia cerradoensis]